MENHTYHKSICKTEGRAVQWWHTPLIPALGRQRHAVLWPRPAWSAEDSQDYAEKPCLEKTEERKLESDIFWVSWSALGRRTREVCRNTQRFRALALQEGLNSVLRSHCGQGRALLPGGSDALFRTLWVSAYMWHAHKHIQRHIKKY